MELRTANKIKFRLSKDLTKNINLFIPYLINRDGKKLSNPLSWELKKVVKLNKKGGLYDR